MSETWAWISGWGVQPERFKAAADRALPGATHHVLAPDPDAVDTVLSSGATHFGGYSLGSLLLMNALERIDRSNTVTCIAPIPSFCKEAELGGRTPRSILESLQVKLARKPEAALKLFYRLAGLADEPIDTLPYSIDSLEWGLEMLATQNAPTNELERVHAIIGETDPLMSAETLRTLFPNQTSTAQGHDYNNLFPAIARS